MDCSNRGYFRNIYEHPGYHDCQRCDPSSANRLWSQPELCTVGSYCLHFGARRGDAAHAVFYRTLGHQTVLYLRTGSLYYWVGAVRPGLEPAHTYLLPYPASSGRRLPTPAVHYLAL